MKIELNFNKKQMIAVLVFVGLLIAFGVSVVAYTSGGLGGNPAVMGHSVDEIDWSKTINSNIKVNGTVTAKDFCINGGNCLSSVTTPALSCEVIYQGAAKKDVLYSASCDTGYTVASASMLCNTGTDVKLAIDAGSTEILSSTTAAGLCASNENPKDGGGPPCCDQDTNLLSIICCKVAY